MDNVFGKKLYLFRPTPVPIEGTTFLSRFATSYIVPMHYSVYDGQTETLLMKSFAGTPDEIKQQASEVNSGFKNLSSQLGFDQKVKLMTCCGSTVLKIKKNLSILRPSVEVFTCDDQFLVKFPSWQFYRGMRLRVFNHKKRVVLSVKRPFFGKFMLSFLAGEEEIACLYSKTAKFLRNPLNDPGECFLEMSELISQNTYFHQLIFAVVITCLQGVRDTFNPFKIY